MHLQTAGVDFLVITAGFCPCKNLRLCFFNRREDEFIRSRLFRIGSLYACFLLEGPVSRGATAVSRFTSRENGSER